MSGSLLTNDRVLAAADPAPVERLEVRDRAPVVLACEHAGRTVPLQLIDQAPSDQDMSRHIACDLGAESVARQLATFLGSPLVMQRYSRLVIDCNRPRHAPDLAPAIADGSFVGFNQDLDHDCLEARWRAIHQPFHDALAETLDQHVNAALVTVHSFTPQLNGVGRPWHIGFLARSDMSLANSLCGHLKGTHPEFVTALNQPYQIEDDSDFTIPAHGERRHLRHVLIEIRNDLIVSPGQAIFWAEVLAGGLRCSFAG